MSTSEMSDRAEWLAFVLEIVLQAAIGAGVVLLGVSTWPSEMGHGTVRSIPLRDWVLTGAGTSVAAFGLVVLGFAVARIFTALRSGPTRT
ncbi:MAG: hypothetical protein M0015_01050 [Betaproteobacteria bacterium]|nr:hypothetical protein [Betaproteobacteria bacterium]